MSYPKKIRLLRDKYPNLRGDIYTLKYKVFSTVGKDKDRHFTVSNEPYQMLHRPGSVWFAHNNVPWYVSENGDSVPAGDYSRKDWFEVVDEVKQTVKIGEESYELTEQQAEEIKKLITSFKGK